MRADREGMVVKAVHYLGWRAELTGDTEDTGGIYLHLFSPNAERKPVCFWGATLDDVLQQLLDFNIVVDWGSSHNENSQAKSDLCKAKLYSQSRYGNESAA